MNDDQEQAEVRRSFTALLDSMHDVRLERPAEVMFAKARTRRLRRGLSGAVGVAAALAVGLGVALPSAGAGPAHGRHLVHVNLDAWSVNQAANGKVYVTFHELKDAAALRHALAEAGVPALVQFDKSCWTARHRPATGVFSNGTGREGDLVITPSAIPKGWDVDLGVFPEKQADVAAAEYGLIKAGAPLHCAGPQTAKDPVASGSGTASAGQGK